MMPRTSLSEDIFARAMPYGSNTLSTSRLSEVGLFVAHFEREIIECVSIFGIVAN